jgi:hypothetical protein
MQVTKYYTNSNNQITHAEVSHTEAVGETTGTAVDLFQLRSPLEEYTEEAVIKSIAIRSAQISNLVSSAKRQAAIASLTETEV